MPSDRPIKVLIWIYLVLLLIEGSLRKWVFPGLSDWLLITRDPVVLLIYLLALGRNRLPFNGLVLTATAMGIVTLVWSLLAEQENLLITLYGLRINYLHLPMIWVMGTVLTRRDVDLIGKFLLVVAIPMTILMVLQFYAPQDHFLNRGGGGEEGGQMMGAAGHIRPPGTFSFNTGPQIFYPIAAALFSTNSTRTGSCGGGCWP